MQAKTIEKHLSKKMFDWLETIAKDDKQLADDVRKNYLISGGSIANLLLGEEVNDYDIYIQDRDVLMRLCQHYAKDTPLQILDGDKREDYLRDYHNENEDALISARHIAIKTLKPGQIKFYDPETKGAGVAFNKGATEEQLKEYIPVFISPNAISLSNKVQIVNRFHGTPEQIHETFDFIHATNYFTHNDGLQCNVPALLSLMTKTLKYQGSHYPVTSIIRLKKFLNRKFRISAGEILKILVQVSQLDLLDPEVLEEQLIGVDIAYFSTLITALRNVKDHTPTEEYLFTMIDRIFGDSPITE